MSVRGVDTQIARDLALSLHRDHVDGAGRPLVEHLARVAASVPPAARAVGWLHDALERTSVTAAELRAIGLTAPEFAALDLLSRTPAEDYAFYILRIARADGLAGALARTVKLADLDDHIGRGAPPGAPPYEWARRRIMRRAVRQRRISARAAP